MILRYKGEWIKTNNKWSGLDFKEKTKYLREYLSEQTKYILECLKEIPGNLKDYWTGYVEVRTHDIFCGGDKPLQVELYGLLIIYGKHNRGQYISLTERDTVEKIVTAWKFSDKKKFHLCLNAGDGTLQHYSFSRRQKDMLVRQLEPLLHAKWYKEV